MTPPYFTLLTAVLLVFSAPCLAQTVVTTSSTPTERHVMGIGDRVTTQRILPMPREPTQPIHRLGPR